MTTGDELAEFDWDSTITSMVLSSFYWMYVVSQVVGGIATQRFGTKAVFGWSQFVTALGSLCIPFAASTHWLLLIFVRSVQGFASGLTWPAMYAIVGPWIPPVRKTKFYSRTFSNFFKYFLGGTIALHVEFSRLFHRHWTHISFVWLHHRPFRMATGFLHDGHHWHSMVHHVVLPRLQHAVRPSENIATGTRVHWVERVGGNQGTSRHESTVAIDFHESPCLGDWRDDVRPYLGSLHLHHARTSVHEKHSEFRHSKERNHVWHPVYLLVLGVCCVLLRCRHSCKP